MPCMCGDLCCPSCGPAQGNHRCPNCGVWSGDGGCVDPVACEQVNKAAAESEAAFYAAENALEKHLTAVHGLSILQYAVSDDTDCKTCQELSKAL